MTQEDQYLKSVAKALCLKHKIEYDELISNFHLNLPKVENDHVLDSDQRDNFDQVLDLDKRVLTGSYYTPDVLAEKMVQLAFVDYFRLNDILSSEAAHNLFINMIRPEDDRKKKEIIEKLKSMSIMDLSCGSGIFLKEAYLLLEKVYILLGESQDVNVIIKQLYGIDIQDKALLLLKIWFLDKQLSHKVETLPCQLLCRDAILYEDDKRYDLLIGNPPYIGEKGNKDIFKPYKSMPSYEGKMDLFYFFIYKGLELLKPYGVLNYITTNYFITADGASKMRSFIKDSSSFMRMINLDACKLFKDAPGMHNLIFSITPKKDVLCDILTVSKKRDVDLKILETVDYTLEQKQLYGENNNIILYNKKVYATVNKKVIDNSHYKLEDLININQGIVSGADRVTQNMIKKKLSETSLNNFNIQVDDPIFVLTKSDRFKELIKPFYKNSHIKAYSFDLSLHQWILYITDNDLIDESDEVYNHLLPYKEVLDKRREVMNGRRKWYALQWYRRQEIFSSPKIVVPQRSKYNTFAYVEEDFYASADVYYLTGDKLKPLLGILNSKLIYFWLYTRGKRKGKDLELYAKPLGQIPIPDLSKLDLSDITKMVEGMILTKSNELQEKIDQWVYSIYNLSEEEINVVEGLYPEKRSINEK